MNTHIYKYKLKKIAYLTVIIQCLAMSCIEPYDPKITKYNNLLVVEGNLSNLPGSGHVILSRTYPYSENSGEEISGATIFLIAEDGNQYRFTNYETNKYSIEDQNFIANNNTWYKLHIETKDGSIYESSHENVPLPVPIDKIDYNTVLNDPIKSNGVQIIIDVNNENPKAQYFMWNYSETWEFQVPFHTYKVPNSSICYRYETPPIFLIESASQFSNNKFTNYPLYYIDNTSNRLIKKYSTLINQHVISKNAFEFYKKIIDLNENTGSLFDKAPITITGNLSNVNNADEPVLGYFLVSAISSKRLFINNSDLTNELNIPTGYEYCEMDEINKNDSYFLDSLFAKGWVVMDTLPRTNPIDTLLRLSKRECFDCKMHGTNIKPNFWK